MYCQNCGSQIAEGSNYCSNCGTRVTLRRASHYQGEKKLSRNGFLRYIESIHPREKNALFLGVSDLEAFLIKKRYIKKSILDLSSVHDVELLIDVLNTKTGLFGIYRNRNAKYARTLDLYRGYLLANQRVSSASEENAVEKESTLDLTPAPAEMPDQITRMGPVEGTPSDNSSSGKRNYTSAEANMLLAKHRKLRDALYAIDDADEAYTEEIKKASVALQTRAVQDTLDGIPIEEINREKSGFRVKAFKDIGYETIGDIANKSVYSLSNIRGVSEDSAYAIHHIVNDIVATTREKTKIRLNADNRTPEASDLVLAIAKQRATQALQQESQEQLEYYKKQIVPAMKALKPGASSFGWMFAGLEKRNKANEAYRFLRSALDGPYGRAAVEQAKRFNDISKYPYEKAWADFIRDPVRFTNTLEDINPGVLGNDDSIYGLPEELAREVQEECLFPDGLLCELRRYQEWGVKYILHQGKVLLGDEMGLGKTVQAIAAMVSLRNTGATHFVVVCPASVITNWCREIQKMSRLNVIKVHGAGRKAALQTWLRAGGVAVTTYETTGFFKLPENYQFSLIVVDEAHYIKNPEAQRTKNVKSIGEHAQRLLFMTGTALENKVEEMVALIRMLRPDIASGIEGMTYLSAAPEFRQAVAPVYYRRKREDVLTELPDLIENKEWCSLGAQEESVYEHAILSKNYAEARRVSWNVDDPRFSSKAKRMMELIEEAGGDGRKVIVFSFFLDTIRKVTMLLGNRCLQPINGSVSPQRRQEIIDEFDSAPPGTVLAAQIQSGGTGLNIQSASVVIICEPQFKPSIENQAISRAYRMGQARNVLVYRLLCENTIDEKLMSVLESKQELFDAFADKSVAAAENLNIDDRTFGNIIQEEIERINEKNQAKQSK